jgi:isopentenyl diphosphate isomerase/L-lactate dehydrogenase-like FMN-dependent dehydrogenase
VATRTVGWTIHAQGLVRVDDAKRAMDAGVSAISVSNHGGNNLDGTPATIRCLPAVAEAVGDRVEVLLDGGVRRGSDVVKAVGLGARAVMIGHAYLGAWPPTARPVWRTFSTSCAAASTRR